MKKYCIYLFVILIHFSCSENKAINKTTYFLSVADQFPFNQSSMVDSLTKEQLEMIDRNNLNVYIPNGYKSIVDEDDREALIFMNEADSSLILSKAFEMNDSVRYEILSSEKYNHPVYGSDYNDLSEFKHFKSSEAIIAKGNVGPFLFGGTLYDLLGASETMHQEFMPKNNFFGYGEFVILLTRKSYVFICYLRKSKDNVEDLNNRPSSFAIRYN
ncbi:hypothetical protein H8S95_01715 [Pontibacter sp. KCTC 32443]|uniref:hypothetical protein n=1 Tax=Pontibacter TaxID=323449 RepID=UPI00164D84B1|nr:MULTISPECIES: hypothetical protein [Pontibacter]MBC5772766.1 hypothetical protein [Pontibacter sp. KCTC 32443]